VNFSNYARDLRRSHAHEDGEREAFSSIAIRYRKARSVEGHVSKAGLTV
jgi:hypothetical protein